MNKLKISICFLVLAAMSITGSKIHATEAGAKAEAQRIANALSSWGWDFRSYYSWGTLDEGESSVFKKTFYSGNEYVLVAGGCEYASDVDLEIYDGNYNLIGKDSNAGKAAAVTFSPSWTGEYYIKVKMYDATSTGVHWVLQYGYR